MSTYLSMKEVCAMLGIHRSTLHRMVYERKSVNAYHLAGYSTSRRKDGKRKAQKIFFKYNEIEKFLQPVQPSTVEKRRAKRGPAMQI